MRWRKYIEHYYRFRVTYSHYRECVRQHYTKSRLSNKRKRIPCDAILQSRGYTNCFVYDQRSTKLPTHDLHQRLAVSIQA